MPQVLIAFAHPALRRSRVNRALADAVRGLPGVTFRDLYEVYPELDIRVAEEQELLLEHDVLVMQHPLYWYSSPAIVKEWLDLVLEHGWAYGHDGTHLRGKTWLTAITSGGTADAYSPEGMHGVRLRDLLLPFERTAALCGMRYLPPFAVHGSLRLDDAEIAAAAEDYRRVVEALRDGVIDHDAVADAPRLNEPALMAGLGLGMHDG
jgi:glutathione-regulated potassium-efflux system ancillary protein KefG